jgi:splicing factor 1
LSENYFLLMPKFDFGQKSEAVSGQLPVGLKQHQVPAYLLHLRLEEVNNRLRQTELANPEEHARLQQERSTLIEEAFRTNPAFQTPIDYSKHIRDHREAPFPSRFREGSTSSSPHQQQAPHYHKKGPYKYQEKIWIPQREYPDINFIGLIIGPRGHTLKKMENDTQTKIVIRGKGSLKEGKNDAASLAAADEELHALVMGDTIERLSRAVKMLNRIIETATSGPDEANELKKAQLRELATLNGTLPLKDSSASSSSAGSSSAGSSSAMSAADSTSNSGMMSVCGNCGGTGHRKFECPRPPNVTVATVCRVCGGVGHTALDCLQPKDPSVATLLPQPPSSTNNASQLNNNSQASNKPAALEVLDEDYLSFLADVGDNRVAQAAMQPRRFH